MTVDPTRVAFVLEALKPGSTRRLVDLVFMASTTSKEEPEPREPDLEARFVPLAVLSDLRMRPPLAGYLRALSASGAGRTAAYLGNLWRPESNDTTPGASEPEGAR